MTETLYHVTDAANAESIQNNGLKGDERGYVFLTESVEEALYIGDIYHTVSEPVVFKADVAESKLRDDPDPHGDLNSWAHRGDISPDRLELVDGSASDREMTEAGKARAEGV